MNFKTTLSLSLSHLICVLRRPSNAETIIPLFPPWTPETVYHQSCLTNRTLPCCTPISPTMSKSSTCSITQSSARASHPLHHSRMQTLGILKCKGYRQLILQRSSIKRQTVASCNNSYSKITLSLSKGNWPPLSQAAKAWSTPTPTTTILNKTINNRHNSMSNDQFTH